MKSPTHAGSRGSTPLTHPRHHSVCAGLTKPASFGIEQVINKQRINARLHETEYDNKAQQSSSQLAHVADAQGEAGAVEVVEE